MDSEFLIPEPLLKQLNRLRVRIIAVAVAGGVGLTMFVASLAFVAAIILDLSLDLTVAQRAGLLAGVILTGLVTAAFTMARPVLRRYSNKDLAAFVEASYPNLNERLLSSIEFAEDPQPDPAAGSPIMRRWLLSQTLKDARKHDFAGAVDASSAIRRCWLGAAMAIALLLPLLVAGEAYGSLLARFFDPWGSHERVQNLILTVRDADRTVGRGDDVMIAAEPSWRFFEATRPETAWLEWTADDEPPQRRRLDWNDVEQAYVAILARVQTGFDYHVAANSSCSNQHRINVADRPEIAQFSAEVVPPAYTGQPAVHYDAVLGEMTAVEQSRIDFQVRFKQPVAAAEILWLDSSPTTSPIAIRDREQETLADGAPVRARMPMNLAADRTVAELDWLASLDGPSGRFLVRVVNDVGLRPRQDDVRRLTVQPDAAPVIEFTDAERQAEARPDDVVEIPFAAADDFGLARLELHYEYLRSGGLTDRGMIEVPRERLGGKSLEHQFSFDLATLKLTFGTQLSLRARATDERPVPRPNETWTDARILHVHNDAKPYGERTIAEQQQLAEEILEKLKAKIDQQQEQSRKFEAEARTANARQTPWNRDEQLAAMHDQLKQLTAQLQQLAAALDRQPLTESLADQARQIAQRPLSEAADKVEQARQEPLPDKPQSLGEAAESLQQASEQLSQLQAEHRQLAKLQQDLLDLNQLAANTERLAEQVDDLAKRQGQLPAESDLQRDRWDRDHRELVSRQQRIEKHLDELLKRRPDLLDRARENVQQELAQLAERTENLARQQQQLANANQSSSAEATEANEDPQRLQEHHQRSAGDVSQQLQQRAEELASPQPREQGQAARDSTPSGQAPGQSPKSGDKASTALKDDVNPQNPATGETQDAQTDKSEQSTSPAERAPEQSGLPGSEANDASQDPQRLQERYQRTAGDISEQLQQRAEELASPQLDRPAQSQQARQAGELATAAAELMQQANQERQREQGQAAGDSTPPGQAPGQSPKPGDKASTELKDDVNPQNPATGETQDAQTDKSEQPTSPAERAPEQSRLPGSEFNGQKSTPQESNQGQTSQTPGASDGAASSQQPPSASQQQQAAEKLEQSAQAARQACGGPAPNEAQGNPVPGEVGRQVAKSAQQLNAAGEQLAQLGSPASAIAQNPAQSSSQQADGQQPGQPGQAGTQAGESQGERQSQSTSANSLRQAAETLRQAAQSMGLSTFQGDSSLSEGSTSKGSGKPGDTSSESGGQGQSPLGELGSALGEVSERDWGKLPGTLRNELLESSQRRPDGDYARLIRKYFQDISRARTPRLQTEETP